MDDLAVAQRDAAIGPLHEAGIVGGDDHRRTVGVELVEDAEQRVLAGGVEADERLVDEQQLEGADEAERDRGLLAQAAAEPGRQVVGAVAELDPLDQLVELVRTWPPRRGGRPTYARCSRTERSS